MAEGSLGDAVAAMERQIIALERTRGAQETTIAELEATVAHQNTTIENLRGEVFEQRTRGAAVGTQLEIAKRQYKALETDAANAQQSVLKLGESCREKDAEIAKLRAELARAREFTAPFQLFDDEPVAPPGTKLVKNAAEAMTSLMDDVASLEQQLTNANARARHAEDKAADLQARLDARESSEERAAVGQAMRLKQLNDQHLHKIRNQGRDIARLSAVVTILQERLDSIGQGELATIEKPLMQGLIQVADAVARLQAEVDLRDDVIKGLRTELTIEKQLPRRDLQQAITTREHQLKKQETTIAQQAREIENLQERIERQRPVVEKAREVAHENTRLNELMEAAETGHQKALEAMRTRVDDLQRLADGRTNEVTAVRKRFADVDAKLHNLEIVLQIAVRGDTINQDWFETRMHGINADTQKAVETLIDAYRGTGR